MSEYLGQMWYRKAPSYSGPLIIIIWIFYIVLAIFLIKSSPFDVLKWSV